MILYRLRGVWTPRTQREQHRDAPGSNGASLQVVSGLRGAPWW
jgi:hypothetical protein